MTIEYLESQNEYEPAEVVAVFWSGRSRERKMRKAAKVSPLRFIRSPNLPSRNQEHRIARVISTTKLYDGIYPIIHFHVEDCAGSHFHLVYDTKCFTWKVKPEE